MVHKSLQAMVAVFVVSVSTVPAAEPNATADAMASPPASFASEDAPSRYFRRHAEGWFWYHDPIETEEAPTTPSARLPPPIAIDPEKAIADERHTLEVALDRALLQPTPENVETYLALNQKLMNQASTFAQAWRGVVWTHPELDHTVQSPVGPAAYLASNLSVDGDENKLAVDAKQWGLLFFFKGSCPYCHKFAPLLRQFAQRYGFQLIAVSQDGGGLPEFPQPQADAGASAALGIDAVPAVFVVNPATRTVAPAVFGLVSWTELTQRVRYAIDHADDNAHDAPTSIAATAH